MGTKGAPTVARPSYHPQWFKNNNNNKTNKAKLLRISAKGLGSIFHGLSLSHAFICDPVTYSVIH